jgi:hypothetical protein
MTRLDILLISTIAIPVAMSDLQKIQSANTKNCDEDQAYRKNPDSVENISAH